MAIVLLGDPEAVILIFPRKRGAFSRFRLAFRREIGAPDGLSWGGGEGGCREINETFSVSCPFRVLGWSCVHAQSQSACITIVIVCERSVGDGDGSSGERTRI